MRPDSLNDKQRADIAALNALLQTELGHPLSIPEADNSHPGQFYWEHSSSPAFCFGVRTSDTSASYELVSYLPPEIAKADLWLIGHTPHQMPYEKWKALFKDTADYPRHPYLIPVIIDGVIVDQQEEKRLGREWNFDTQTLSSISSTVPISKFVTVPHGHLPDKATTWKFIHAVREARAMERKWKADMEERERKLRSWIRDQRAQYFKDYLLHFRGRLPSEISFRKR